MTTEINELKKKRQDKIHHYKTCCNIKQVDYTADEKKNSARGDGYFTITLLGVILHLYTAVQCKSQKIATTPNQTSPPMRQISIQTQVAHKTLLVIGAQDEKNGSTVQDSNHH